jgi:hypothetical protein
VKLSFIQLSAFSSNWARMKLTDEDLRALEAAIQDAPDGPPVMRGSAGLRKVRFAPASSSSGKSGGARACYAYLPEFGLVYLCAVFVCRPTGGIPEDARADSPLLAGTLA